MPEPGYPRHVQRRAMGLLFVVIGLVLVAIALWSALAGGRAWVVAFAAAALGLWMGDLGRRGLRR